MSNSEKPGPNPKSADQLANSAAEIARDIQQFQRRGPEGIADRMAVLVDLEERAIDLAAMSEDGLLKTLSAGSILAVLDHWERLCRRLGGDEFAIWLEENDEEGAAASADKLLESTASLHQFSGSPEKPLGLSIGIAVYDPSSLESVEDLVSRADEAMYVIKKGSKGGYVISDPAPKSDESTSGVMEASS